MEICLKANKVEVFMLCKYVDDINLATAIIRAGQRWREIKEDGKKVRKLVHSDEDEEADRESDESDEERTIRLITEEASKQIPGIKFTYDIPEKHEDRKCPVLDLAVWAREVKETGIRI